MAGRVLALALAAAVAAASLSAPALAAPAPAAHKSVRVYLMRGERLWPVRRDVGAVAAVGAAAVKSLLLGPTRAEAKAGFTTSIPAHTRFLGLTLRSGVATVDLTNRYASGGGSLSMSARLAQVVFTLTQFPSVRTVRFAMNHRAVTVFSGEGLVLDRPVGRSAYESLAPAVLVEGPLYADTVRSPLRVWGSANTFEATFYERLVGKGGKVLSAGPVKASAGTGTRGSFDFTLRFGTGAAGPATLTVYTISAKDGSLGAVMRLPLTLAR